MLLVHRRGVRAEQGGALGLRPTRRLQPRVLAGVRKDSVEDWLVGSERLRVWCPRATLGQFGASLSFLVSGTRAGGCLTLAPQGHPFCYSCRLIS